jgi:hypothetical protein
MVMINLVEYLMQRPASLISQAVQVRIVSDSFPTFLTQSIFQVAFDIMKLQNVQVHHLPFVEACFLQEPFSRKIKQRSWEVIKQISGITMDIKTLENVDISSQFFGIFLSDSEKAQEPWSHHLKIKGYKAKIGQAIISEADLSTLKPKGWLNDEIINGYLDLLDGVSEEDTLLLNSRFWKDLTASHINRTSQRYNKMLRNYVRYSAFIWWW